MLLADFMSFFKTKDNNKSNNESIDINDNIYKRLNNEGIHINKLDIKEFKEVVEKSYKDLVYKYKDLIQKYHKDFEVPTLRFDLEGSSKINMGVANDPDTNFKILAFYERNTKSVIIEPGLFYQYFSHQKRIDSIDDKIAHEIAHSIIEQLGFSNIANYKGEDIASRIVKDELLANLFAAEVGVKKRGLPISNKAVANELIKNNSDLSKLLKMKDDQEKYLDNLEKYSNRVQEKVKSLSDYIEDEIKSMKENGLQIDYAEINSNYLKDIQEISREYLGQITKNYAVTAYGAPTVGTVKALLNEKMSVDEIITNISKDISSVSEINEYLEGGIGAVTLEFISPKEPDFLKQIIEEVITKESLNEKKDNYDVVFQQISDKIESEFEGIYEYTLDIISSKKKLLSNLPDIIKDLNTDK